MCRAWTLQALLAVMLVAASVGHGVDAQTINSPNKDAGAAKSSKPVDGQDALDSAAKSLEAGKTEQAIQQVNGLLSGARLQGRSMARALYLRGAAYQKQGKPAQAIADLTSALWLKGGLSDADRIAATSLRSEAYRAAGLNDLADADAKKVGRTPAPQTASAASPQVDAAVRNAEGARKTDAEQKPAQQSASPGGVSGFFSNLFGSSPSASSAAAGSAGSRPEPNRSAPTKQSSVGDAWSTAVNSGPAASTRPAASAKQAASVREETAAIPAREEAVLKPATAAPRLQGRYRLQVAAVRGRSEAQAVAARLKKDYATALAGREPEVDETVIGNMGTFYRVRIGPFANAAEPATLCTKLRGVGLDCLIMAE
jgi:cell division protein FtsN